MTLERTSLLIIESRDDERFQRAVDKARADPDNIGAWIEAESLGKRLGKSPYEHSGEAFDIALKVFKRHLKPFKKGRGFGLDGKAEAIQYPLMGDKFRIATFSHLPMTIAKLGQSLYRDDTREIIIKPMWNIGDDIRIGARGAMMLVESIKKDARTTEEQTDVDLNFYEKKYGIKIAPAVRAKLKKASKATAKRRFGANRVRTRADMVNIDTGEKRQR